MSGTEITGFRIKVTGLPLTERMKRYGITGIVFLNGEALIETSSGSDAAPAAIGHWFAER